jgi:hypothetical protein
MPVPAHQATTRHLGAAYPFASEPGLGSQGVLVGRDLLGGAFVYDPFVLYRAGVLTNPNMVVFGQLGRGKSAFVKSYLWRQAVFGRRAWVVDPKGEYSALARAWGAAPITLRPSGTLRLNPLDAPGDSDDAEERTRRRAELLGSLASASLGRALAPAERTAIELAVAAVDGERIPTLPAVVDALLAPSARSAAAVRTDAPSLAADGRHVALELRRLVSGDLRGMFDGPTTPGLDLRGPIVVLDLSAVYHSAALGVLMTCAAAWLQASLQAEAHAHRPVVFVVDEAWAVLANLGVARWLRSSWKLSRAWGVANLAVLHRVSDLSAAGAAGSEQVAVAEGLLADSETRVLYAQAPGEVTGAATLLGMTSTEAELLSRLGRGVALWKVGTRSFLVQHRLSPGERALVDTDARMVALDESASAPRPPVPSAPTMRRDEWPPSVPVRLAPTGT